MGNVKREKIIGWWANYKLAHFNGHPGLCKVDQSEGCWGCPLDFHHHWSDYCPSSADPSNNSLLLFHRNYLKHGLQAKERLGGVIG